MKKTLFIVFLAFVTPGCFSATHHITPEKLVENYSQNQKPPGDWNNWKNNLFYKGSNAKYHYFCHIASKLIFIKNYKVSKNLLQIEFEFSKTSDETRWQEVVILKDGSIIKN